MKKTTFRLVKIISFITLLILLLQIFLPRRYALPQLNSRPNTLYWNLPTGSKIAYALIAANGFKKSYSIIYLHGGPGGHIREGIIKSLNPLANDGYDIYLYDQIGSGQSARLEDITGYTVNRQIADLAAIIEKVGEGQVILIGQSWGAILATLFAAKYPQKIERLVLTSPGPIFPIHKELASLQAPDSFHLNAPFFTNAQGNKKANNIRTKTMAWLATRFGIKLALDKEADAFATYLNYEVDKSTVCDTTKILPMEMGSGFYASIMTFQNLTKVQDQRAKLKKLNIPVLVMKGQCDNQPWGFTNEYLTVFQNNRLIIVPNAGHYIWVEQPTLHLTTIKQFLSDAIPAPNTGLPK